ncbi:iron-hydroxamate ABC transporter substrate-binding protein [Paenibacillus sp. sgz302251]|uniref:iron-hydroxamate ABC transporter substrate-binding protein n=1 Tax=Paenibacillus sp. sgz302251 TaxID=3414493 RepID=UPI003C7B248B
MLVLVIAACGSGNTNQAGENNSPNNAAATNGTNAAEASNTPASESETVTYKAANGDIEIPKNPKRIALLADYFGYFMQLGIKPVAVTNYSFQNPFFEGLLDGVENIGDGSDLEKIIAAQPDLIFTWDEKSVEQLEKIAPTILIQYGALNYKDQLKEFGKITGTEAKAEEWLASWDAKIAEAKPKLQESVGDKTISIIQTDGKNVYVFGDKFGRGGEILYQELGLNATPATKKETIDQGPGYASISLEKLPEFAGDYIFGGAWTLENTADLLYDSAIWKELPAVKANNVFEIHPIGFYFNDPISLEKQLDFFLTNLVKE